MCRMGVTFRRGRAVFRETPGTLQAPAGATIGNLPPGHTARKWQHRDWGWVSLPQSPVLSPHRTLSLCYHRLGDKTLEKYFQGEIQDSSGLFALCSECSILMNFISPVTSESFPSYSGA